MKRVKPMRGFTLLEVMIASALLAVIIGAAMGAFVSTTASTNQAYAVANTQNDARLTLDALASDLRIAGLGASNGTIGIAPGGLWPMRVPTIYTTVTSGLTDPNGNPLTNMTSIYIVGAEPGTVGADASGQGVEGVIIDPTKAIIRCSTGITNVDCKNAALGTDGIDHTLLVSNGAIGFSPIMLHDHQRASIISPTAVTGTVGAQTIIYSESSGSVVPSPDPTAPFGFAQGFQVSRLRVVHWYLKQDPGQLPRIYRSRPTLTTAGDFTTGCKAPFVDETNGGTVKGAEMGTGPVEALQASFVFDFAGIDDPTQYTAQTSVNPCDPNVLANMRQLREVRVQLVAIAPTQLKDGQNKPIARFTTPTFEGNTFSTVPDAYPRRAYVTRVAPRNFVPYRSATGSGAGTGGGS
ncbi:MAG TPA: prepilin-type N-terminal cleavage/methylation domain-containing protein [Myxococcales bacterium]|jgi:prepilin-type N-terminal cleavage/methylation domain-containing protein|nr:prepilin-type N-terminal cleavage/methylation domain-containing protein [Myxococcales bacterium]